MEMCIRDSTKDPLSPGQSAPKNDKQQKEQNAEEQKPKRKARSVKDVYKRQHVHKAFDIGRINREKTIKQAKEQIPTNENKVQVAVNEQGKTHEATKHTKEPLSPGQSAPKNEKQQKEQNAEGQKPKRKARSVKM